MATEEGSPARRRRRRPQPEAAPAKAPPRRPPAKAAPAKRLRRRATLPEGSRPEAHPNAAFLKPMTSAAQRDHRRQKPPRTEVTRRSGSTSRKPGLRDKIKRTLINADAKLEGSHQTGSGNVDVRQLTNAPPEVSVTAAPRSRAACVVVAGTILPLSRTRAAARRAPGTRRSAWSSSRRRRCPPRSTGHRQPLARAQRMPALAAAALQLPHHLGAVHVGRVHVDQHQVGRSAAAAAIPCERPVPAGCSDQADAAGTPPASAAR